MPLRKPDRQMPPPPPARGDWRAALRPWREKIIGPEAVFARLRPGDTVFVASACAEPQHLVAGLRAFAPRLSDVEIFHLLGSGQANFDEPELADHVRLNSFFIGESSRALVARGAADYTPVFLSEIPDLMRQGQLPIDLALIQVTQPNPDGWCSLGVSVETVQAAIESAAFVLAQVNPHLPWTSGDSYVHVDDLDGLTPHAEEILEFAWNPPGEVTAKIAFHVARLVEDGATVQIGIGKIPDTILPHLGDKIDLGVHTEMFSDNLIDLIESGVVNGRQKTLHQNLVVASFCIGSERLYRFVDRNPMIEFHPADYVGNPRIIEANRKMTAINGALEVDFSGQVCADSIGHRFYSGFGSEVDFMRGAARSPGGKPIIVLPSTAKGDTVSRIVPTLKPGAGVVLTRGDVHYIVTEFGIAYLYGKSIRERTLALIEIAHPKFRPELLEKAKEMNYVYADQRLPENIGGYPERWRKALSLRGGEQITLRPIRLRDEALLQELYYSLSPENLALRFNTTDGRFSHRRVHPETIVDYHHKMTIVATIGPVGRERILGVASYHRDPATGIAECAFTVHEGQRRRGIGTLLLNHLREIALETGSIEGFRVEVLRRNRPMLNLFLQRLTPEQTRDGVHTANDEEMVSAWFLFPREE
jgi:acyl-CoA hydrolase/GNAT superfamily N-acetyltransferase